VVEELPEQKGNLNFVGTYSEFLDAAKALRTEVVFLTQTVVSEVFFRDREQEVDDEQNDAIEAEGVDLCAFLPKLSKYRSKIGSAGQFELSVHVQQGSSLTFSIFADWWHEFIDCHIEARELARQQREADAAKHEAEEDAKLQSLRQKLRDLVLDKTFAKLPTQLAMREYALDRYPEIGALGENGIKQELQSLKASIQARGLGRKQ